MSTKRPVLVETLEHLKPLWDLPPEELKQLARDAEYEDVAARSVVFKKGDHDDFTRYLVSGSLVLSEGPGSEATMVGVGDSAIAPDPIGMEPEKRQTAVARTDVRLIRIPTSKMQSLLEAAKPPTAEVDEVDASDEGIGTQLFYQLFQDLMEDKLNLPSMPDIAVRVRKAISDEEAGPAEVAKILQSDPVVAARVIQAANSAVFAGQSRVDNLSAAVVRLGLKNCREVVMAVALKEVFKTKSPLLNKRMVELWMHSTLVAATASVLAKRMPGFSADRALLAGLVHDIGAVPMLAHAGDYPGLVKDPQLLENTIAEYRGQVGGMILRRWNFPEDMVAVPIDADDFHRDQPGEPDYADLIIVAQLQLVADTHEAANYPALVDTPAFKKLDISSFDISDGHLILDEAKEEIAEVQRLLMGN